MNVYLASKSPRRRQLLGEMGVAFQTVSADCDETVQEGVHPREAVALLAAKKCRAGEEAARDPEGLVIGSDTLVELDGIALGKPRDEADAVRMLLALSGRPHRVHTGVCVRYRGRELSESVTTTVYFRAFDRKEAEAYVATGEPMDKAGAYGIQGLGGRLVEKIEGSFDNVVGFPTDCVRRLMEEVQ
jgi:septum formation protein